MNPDLNSYETKQKRAGETTKRTGLKSLQDEGSFRFVRMTGVEKREDRKFLLECIHVYRELPAIWNVTRKEYHDKDKKQESYDILLDKYREKYPTATKEDLKKKFNSLRTNFRKELKKVQDSKKSDPENVYHSHCWYYSDMLFLAEDHNTDERESRVTFNSDSIKVSNSIPKTLHKLQKKRKVVSEENDIIKLKNHELISLTCKRIRQQENEYMSIAGSWANELSKMDILQQIFAKKAINDILYEGQLGTLHRYSVQINSPDNRTTYQVSSELLE